MTAQYHTESVPVHFNIQTGLNTALTQRKATWKPTSPIKQSKPSLKALDRLDIDMLVWKPQGAAEHPTCLWWKTSISQRTIYTLNNHTDWLQPPQPKTQHARRLTLVHIKEDSHFHRNCIMSATAAGHFSQDQDTHTKALRSREKNPRNSKASAMYFPVSHRGCKQSDCNQVTGEFYTMQNEQVIYIKWLISNIPSTRCMKQEEAKWKTGNTSTIICTHLPHFLHKCNKQKTKNA